MQVLLVEDETDLCELIGDYLQIEDIDCDFAYNGAMACNLLAENHYDVVVLDVMMPKMDGLTVCRTIRERGDNTPVLMLTARDALDDKLEGFASGANDYLVKPFDLPELVARLKVLARVQVVGGGPIQVGDLVIDEAACQATRAGRTVQLTPIGWKLLLCLAKSAGSVVSRVELADKVWGDAHPSDAVLKTQLHRLRSAVDMEGEAPLVKTVKGIGVMLKADD